MSTPETIDKQHHDDEAVEDGDQADAVVHDEDGDQEQDNGAVPTSSSATATDANAAALKIKSVPVSTVAPYDLVYVHSDWVTNPAKIQDTLATSSVLNSSTKILLVVPNSGNWPAQAFAMVSGLSRKLCTVWKVVFLRSAANKKDLSSTPVCNKTPSFDANDGFVRPSTQQIWLLASDGDEICTPKGRVLESQELFACGTQIVLDHVSDYFGADRMLIIGSEPPIHPEFNSYSINQPDVVMFPQRTFTMKSCKKGRILSAYLRSRPLKELKEGRVALTALHQVPVDDAGVQAIEAVREEFLSFLPVVDSIAAHSALVEFCAQNRFKSRLARRISALHKAEREARQSSTGKRGRTLDDENDVAADESVESTKATNSGAKRQKRASTSRNGIAAPSAIVPKLADFLNKNFSPEDIGADANGHVARTVAVKLITRYVRENSLQSKEAKTKFVMDESLKTLFDATASDNEPVRFFDLPKKMNFLFPRKSILAALATEPSTDPSAEPSAEPSVEPSVEPSSETMANDVDDV